jgi:hypothetical protein
MPGAPSPSPPLPRAGPATIDAASWDAVVEAANLSGMLRQFALNCVPTGFDNDVLRLQLDAAAADRRSRQIEDKLVHCLSTYLGKEIRVVFETVDSSIMTPARLRALKEHDKVQRAAVAFDEDPAVKGLRERFGADVEAGSVKPSN